MTPTSINPTDRKNPLRSTPWTGRLILTLAAALLSVTAAMVFKNVTASKRLLGAVFMISVSATIASLILLGRIGKYNMLRRRVCVMTWSTYLLSVAGRLTATFGSTSFMSCSLFSILWMASMALLQVPNMTRAVEIRKAEDMAERETLWSDPSSFHRFSGKEPLEFTNVPPGKPTRLDRGM